MASGAIFSNYQRLRVENVCQRLGLISLGYLWYRDQTELLDEMIECQMEINIVKTCSMGLTEDFLGNPIQTHREKFAKMKD